MTTLETPSLEEPTHFLVKLSHLKEPGRTREEYPHGPIPEDEKYYGCFLEPPTVGHSFLFFVPNIDDILGTSTVRSLYSPSATLQGGDKLVLPAGFPEPEKLEIPELLENDILIATMNSLYLLREIPIMPPGTVLQ